MPVRHQILRHMDAAWEVAFGRPVFGLVVVEGEGDTPEAPLPAAWATYGQDVVTPSILAASLPHRDQAVRGRLAGGALGVTTWQALCAATGVRWQDLPKVPVEG